MVLLQLKGLEDGYNDQLVFPTGHFSIDPMGFMSVFVSPLCCLNKYFLLFIVPCYQYVFLLVPTRLFQMGGDVEDLESALNKSSQTRPLGSGSCSALIKLLPNNKELFVSQDTWNNYQAMLRIIKKYRFAFKASSSGRLACTQ